MQRLVAAQLLNYSIFGLVTHFRLVAGGPVCAATDARSIKMGVNLQPGTDSQVNNLIAKRQCRVCNRPSSLGVNLDYQWKRIV